MANSSDDEYYNPSKQSGENVWEPDPKTIVALYEKLEKDNVLELEWKCTGHITNEPQELPKPIERVEATPEVQQELHKQKLITMFEEDDLLDRSMEILTQGLQKTQKTPRSAKPKASFDKILNRVNSQKTAKTEAKTSAKMSSEKS